MYVNGKMRCVETIPGMEADKIKENDREVDSSDIKNFCKCHNVSPVQ
jgi:hypothetical protein